MIKAFQPSCIDPAMVLLIVVWLIWFRSTPRHSYRPHWHVWPSNLSCSQRCLDFGKGQHINFYIRPKRTYLKINESCVSMTLETCEPRSFLDFCIPLSLNVHLCASNSPFQKIPEHSSLQEHWVPWLSPTSSCIMQTFAETHGIQNIRLLALGLFRNSKPKTL